MDSMNSRPFVEAGNSLSHSLRCCWVRLSVKCLLFTLLGTFADAANEMSGNILVVYPPGGQMENYISAWSVTESERTKTHFVSTHHSF